MTQQIPDAAQLPTALAEAAALAGHAPSVHNTQPWRWRVLPDRLELSAARDRQLAAVDPDGRLLTLSCGAALQHARVALAAEGFASQVERMPEASDPDLLARIVVTGRASASPEAERAARSIRQRHTDRRPVSEEPVPEEALRAIGAAAESEGTRWHLLRPGQVLELAAAASRAQELEAGEPQIAEELRYWTGRAAPEGAGLTPEVLPQEPPRTTVPGRDFGRPGTLPIGPGHDRAAVYALLYGDDDEPESWLRAGEALAAAWLAATELGVSVVPLSGAIEVVDTRQTLRRILAGLGHPYLALRLGMPNPALPVPPRTPRLPTEQIVDTSAVRAAGS